MDYQSLYAKTVADLRKIAKEAGVRIPAATKKATMVELILEGLSAAGRAQAARPEAQSAASEQSAAPGQAVVSEQSTAPEQAAAPEQSAAPEQTAAPKKAAASEQAVAPQQVVAPEQAVAPAQSAAPQQAVASEQTAAPEQSVAPQQTAASEQAAAPQQEAGEGRKRAQGRGAQPRRKPGEAPKGERADRATQPRGAKRDAPAAPSEAAEPKAAPEPSAAPERAEAQPQPLRQRPLNTQQRMGARTQPTQGYRPQPRGAVAGRAPARAASDAPQRRGSRAYDASAGGNRTFDASAGGNRRPADALSQRGAPRRAPEAAGQEMSAPVALARPAAEEGAPLERTQPMDAPAPAQPVNSAEMYSGSDYADGSGILEIHPDGYGFLRAENYLPGNRDVYVSATQIRRFNLRTGDYVVGKTRAQQLSDRSVGLIYISEVNGQAPDMARRRRSFDTLVPIYPDERLRMERPESGDISLRLIDMIAPIGKGQRGMIVSPPKAGKTTLLKKIANAITANNPDVHLIVLLIDERPEEVTDMRRSIQGEVVYSTFDEAPENHTRVSEMVLERAQRLVELGTDVVVLLDSITRLARAYNLVIPPTGRSLSGGLDPGALFRPKRFFGAARNIENGGSLTIIATALVDTGSRMDDIIFEEFKGTGNMELHLDRSLSDRRIFPALDLYRSGTRREELLMSKEELEGVYQVRRVLSKGSPQEAAEQLISLIEKTKTNIEFFQKLKGWMSVYEKEGFSMR